MRSSELPAEASEGPSTKAKESCLVPGAQYFEAPGVILEVWARRHGVAGVEITSAPDVLRHFSAHFRRVRR